MIFLMPFSTREPIRPLKYLYAVIKLPLKPLPDVLHRLSTLKISPWKALSVALKWLWEHLPHSACLLTAGFFFFFLICLLFKTLIRPSSPIPIYQDYTKPYHTFPPNYYASFSHQGFFFFSVLDTYKQLYMKYCLSYLLHSAIDTAPLSTAAAVNSCP